MLQCPVPCSPFPPETMSEAPVRRPPAAALRAPCALSPRPSLWAPTRSASLTSLLSPNTPVRQSRPCLAAPQNCTASLHYPLPRPFPLCGGLVIAAPHPLPPAIKICIRFPGAAAVRYHKLDGLNDRRFFSQERSVSVFSSVSYKGTCPWT